MLYLRVVADRLEDEHADEHGGHRSCAQTADQLEIDRPPAEMHDRAGRLITALATRSLETAVKDETLKNRTSIDVKSTPPPIPVNPTTMPTATHQSEDPQP